MGFRVKIFRTIGRIRQANRGDTIIEVLLAIAILGAVLGGAFVAANRNTLVNRSSQERLEAIKVGEAQLERLKAKVSSPDDSDQIFSPPANFCIDQANNLATGSASCTLDAAGTSGQPASRYLANVQRDANLSPRPGVTGIRFIITVSWSSVLSGQETLSYKYEVFR